MGTIYRRGRKLWVGYKDAAGKWRYAATDLEVGQEAKARKVLEAIERRVKAGQAFGEAEQGPVTLQRYFERWIADRHRRGIGSAKDDESRLTIHALPSLGHLVLKDIRPAHVRRLVRDLRARCGPDRDQLAPRTVRHVYGVLHRLFEDAVADELIETNPCALKRGELPPKLDKDPSWRAGAVFTREELEQLISDERIPEDRRTFYAVAFLTGMRAGEVSAARWKHYDPATLPLGKLLVARSYSTKNKLEKGVKTGRAREAPVHPLLAKLLAAWRTEGWPRMFGRVPGPDDLIVPSREGKNRTTNHMLKKFHEDCERLGFRQRRQHDSRRTLISLAQADGARKDILRWITHGPDGDIMDVYTTLPWAALCEEIAKLRLNLRQSPETPPTPGGSRAPALPLAETQPPTIQALTPEASGALLQPLLQTQRANGKAPKFQELEGPNSSGGGGNRSRLATVRMHHRAMKPRGFPQGRTSRKPPMGTAVHRTVATVAAALGASQRSRPCWSSARRTSNASRVA